MYTSVNDSGKVIFPVSLYFVRAFLCFGFFYFEVLPAKQEVDENSET